MDVNHETFLSSFNIQFGNDIAFLLSGRTALDFIIVDIKKSSLIKSVALPSYCCHTMIEPFLSNSITVQFYDIILTEKGLSYNFESLNPETFDVILLIDYFGYSFNTVFDSIPESLLKEKIVIYDATHSVFSHKMDRINADYIYMSFRKWAFFSGVAVAVKSNGKFTHCKPKKINEKYISKRNTASNLKGEYIMRDKGQKEVFLSLFKEAEKMLEVDYKDYAADKESINRLEKLNIPFIRSKRQKNATKLLDGLKNNPYIKPIFNQILPRDCPLCVPLRVVEAQRDNLRKHLISNDIYCPVHWPKSELHNLSIKTRSIYDEELSLVCDQRYDCSDMNKILKCINEFYEKVSN